MGGGTSPPPYHQGLGKTLPWEITFSLSSKMLPLLAGNSVLGPINMLPGQLIASGQFTDPRVNFALVYGLTSVTVHMNLSLPRGNFERHVTHCTIPGNRPCQGNFSLCKQNAKVAPRVVLLTLIINVLNKFPKNNSRKHQK